jgi:hypothetical protein
VQQWWLLAAQWIGYRVVFSELIKFDHESEEAEWKYQRIKKRKIMRWLSAAQWFGYCNKHHPVAKYRTAAFLNDKTQRKIVANKKLSDWA